MEKGTKRTLSKVSSKASTTSKNKDGKSVQKQRRTLKLTKPTSAVSPRTRNIKLLNKNASKNETQSTFDIEGELDPNDK